MCFSGYSKLRFIREDPCDSRLNCSAVSALAVIVLIVNNLMVDYDAPIVSPIPLVRGRVLLSGCAMHIQPNTVVRAPN
jgi:hypothetical protein